ncbi:MAG: FtsX-like permease family protein [Verrucomicrobiales bacterium]|nr:FtsX-like permease family protein [Verrucomicrobiales bacterium]
MNWISLAFRNLTRNARRSITTIAAVALGFSAVNIFGGFAAYMFASIQDAHIYEQINGHVQVWKKDGRGYGGMELAEHLLTKADIEEIEAFAENDDRVEIAVRMLEVQGNVDYEGNSGNFMCQAMVPSEKDLIHYRSTALRSKDGKFFEGEAITDETLDGIAITPGMRDRMKLEFGDQVVLLAQTVEGLLNGEDARVVQVLDVVSQALDNLYIFMPLDLAQRLYDTDSVSSVRLLLYNDDDTDAVLKSFQEKFADKEWDILPWYDVSKLYKRTKKMFNIIFGLVFAIIAIIVTMSVLNTIGMAVVERTREIGTLRAIGLKRPGVIKLFGVESAMLGIIGALIGLAITYGFSYIVHTISPEWEPPVTARSVVWEIRLVPVYLAITSILLIVFTALAAIAPARRAARQSIVDSLGHV